MTPLPRYASHQVTKSPSHQVRAATTMTSWLLEGTLVYLPFLESARERGSVVQP